VNNAYHFPLSDGTTGQVLQTDGNGDLSWNDDGGATEINELSDGRTTGNSVFLGSGAGANDYSFDYQNVAVGDSALYANTFGQMNTAIGSRALYTNISGNSNTAIGYHALEHNISGAQNTANGRSALNHNTTGHCNTAVGFEANYYNEEGDENTIIGYEAGGYFVPHNKSRNVFLGCQAGYNATTGSDANVFLGYKAGYSETGSNKLYIENSDASSPLIWGDFTNNRVVINGNSTNNINNRTFFSNGSAGGATAWYNDSDIRLKKNINTISSSLDKVLQLRGVNYEWKETENHEEGLQMGFIAQEVQEVIPEVVDENNGHYTMQYAPITALLVEAVKEQQKVIEELKTRIEELEQK